MSSSFQAAAVTMGLFWAASTAPLVLAADAPASADASKLHTGLPPLAQLLDLMDTDKNGKVSKDEFMSFMQAEFDYADKDKSGELDPTELKNLVFKMNHPYRGTPRVGK